MTHKRMRDRVDSSSPAMVGMKAPPIAKSKEDIARNLDLLVEAVPDNDTSYPLLRKAVHETIAPKARALAASINDETGASHLAALEQELAVLNDRIKNDHLNQPVKVPFPVRKAAISKRDGDIREAYGVFHANLDPHYRECGIELPAAVDGL